MYTTPDSRCRDNARYSFTIFETPVQLEHSVVVIGCRKLGKPLNISERFSGDPIHSVWQSEDYSNLAHAVPFEYMLRVI